MTSDELFKTGGGLDGLREILSPENDPLLGEDFGSYRIEALIAEGGMGRVYRAVRADGQFDRAVAIKVPPTGMGRAYIKRFEQERNILASLSHPKIAQLYDTGLSANGSLFIVMELIDGVPIDEYARHRVLSTTAKIELMAQLSEVLAFAHSKLVVHRDLKPSNVFVTADGELKLLDFGIAKILESPNDVTGDSRPMTPSYASPEQLLNEPVSVASDIYQFGLLFLSLFEPLPELEEDTPEQATARAVSKTSITTDSRIADVLPAELVAIINQCLRAEPAERYATAGDLALDLHNFLGGFPVSARNPGWWTRARKFLQRNTIASAMVGILLVVLLAGNFLYLRELQESRTSAELAATTSAEVTEFLISLFESSDPNEASGSEMTATQILEAGALRVEKELERQPAVRAEILRSIGRIFFSLGEWKRSISFLETALTIQQSLYGDDDPRMADTYAILATVKYEAQEFDEQALAYYAKALDLHLGAKGKDLRYARMLTEWAILEMFVNESYDAAIDVLNDAAEIHDRLVPQDDPERIYTLQQLMRAHERLGEFEVAQAYGERAVEIATQSFGEEHARVASPLFYLARVLESQGQYAEAAAMMRRVLDNDIRAYGEINSRTGGTYLNLAHLLRMSGNLTSAIAHAERSVAVMREAVGEHHSQYSTALCVLAVARQDAGDYDEAEALLQEALAIREITEGPDHTFTAYALLLYGGLFAEMGRYDEAISMHERVLNIWTAVVGPGVPDSAKVELVLGQNHMWLGNLEQAETYLRSALQTHKQALPDDHLRLADNLISLGELLTLQNNADDCAQPIQRGLNIRQGRLPPGHTDMALAKAALAECFRLDGLAAESQSLLEEAYGVLSDSPSAAARRVQERYAVQSQL